MSQSKKEWTKTEVEALIGTYRDFECLWNSQIAGYRDKTRRKKAIGVLSQMFDTDHAEICRKLHNLRNQFASQLRRNKARNTEKDESILSKWPYYDLLKFIQPTLETVTRHPVSTRVRSTEFTKNEALVENIKIEISETDLEDETLKHSDKKSETGACGEDEFDTFGRFVANEIRSLTSEVLRKKLKRKIQRCILEVAEEEEL